MSESVVVTLRADVNQVDETGYVWAFLSDADEPDRVRTGALIVAGDSAEPFIGGCTSPGETHEYSARWDPNVSQYRAYVDTTNFITTAGVNPLERSVSDIQGEAFSETLHRRRPGLPDGSSDVPGAGVGNASQNYFTNLRLQSRATHAFSFAGCSRFNGTLNDGAHDGAWILGGLYGSNCENFVTYAVVGG